MTSNTDKFSPGYWVVSNGAISNNRKIVEDINGLPVCALSLRGVQGKIDRMEANANLIAAAPLMLEVLRNIESTRSFDLTEEDLAMVKSTIKIALGEINGFESY